MNFEKSEKDEGKNKIHLLISYLYTNLFFTNNLEQHYKLFQLKFIFQMGKFKMVIKKSKEEQDKLREKYRGKCRQISTKSPGGIKKPKRTHPMTLRSKKKMVTGGKKGQ